MYYSEVETTKSQFLLLLKFRPYWFNRLNESKNKLIVVLIIKERSRRIVFADGGST